MPVTPYTLTPADIMSLRLWRKSAALSLDGERIAVDAPFIVVAPSDGTLYLHARGRCIAGAQPPQVMCALLLNERLEPGYCARVCDPACTIEEALLDPASRAAGARRLAASQAAERQRQRDLEDTRRETVARNRRSHIREDHSTLTLDDLF